MEYFKIFIILLVLTFRLNAYGQTTQTPTPEKSVEIKKTELKNVESFESSVILLGRMQLPRIIDLTQRDKELIAMNSTDRNRFEAFLDK